ncbi:PucR family transcriptional regulator [Streptomyces sp. or43]|nr:PucR family transcriptional regulator [Streptomyces sp. or43]
METRGGITVQRALELPGLRSGLPEVVTGAERLGRTVRWVHAGEVPNIASLLKGGELLLTTGLGLGTRPAEQRAFVRRLADRGIAALVVELGPRFSRLPSSIVDAARAAGLPLVQLHREVPFVTVTEEIHTEIVNGHYALLQQAEEVHRRCTQALLGGGGVPQVLGILADFTANPVFLETADGQLLYAAGTESGPVSADPLQVWDGMRGDRAARESPPVGAVLVDVPGGGPGTGSVRARLVLLAVDGPLVPVHRMAAERAAGILAVVLMQARQEEELAARGRGDFLTDLAEGRIAPEDAPAQARVLGFRPGQMPLLPVVMRLAPELSPSGNWALLARAVLEELSSVGVPVLLGVRPVEGRVPLLLGLRTETERTAVADRVAAALRAGVARVPTSCTRTDCTPPSGPHWRSAAGRYRSSSPGTPGPTPRARAADWSTCWSGEPPGRRPWCSAPRRTWSTGPGAGVRATPASRPSPYPHPGIPRPLPTERCAPNSGRWSGR